MFYECDVTNNTNADVKGQVIFEFYGVGIGSKHNQIVKPYVTIHVIDTLVGLVSQKSKESGIKRVYFETRK